MNRKKYISYLREKANKHAFYRGANTQLVEGDPYTHVTDATRRKVAAMMQRYCYDNKWKNRMMDSYLMIESSAEAYESFVRNGRYPVFDKRRVKRMQRHYGKPCGQYYHNNCVSCAGWGMFFFYGKFPSSSRVLEYVSSADEMINAHLDTGEVDLSLFFNNDEE